MKKIPISLLIAEVKNSLDKIVQHPELPPAVVEPLLRAAYLEVSIRAEQALSADIKQYKENLEKDDKKEKEG